MKQSELNYHLKKKDAHVFGKSFLAVSWQALNLASYQLTKQMSSFSKKGKKKTLLRVLLFRVQTKQTPVHNNEPASERNIYIHKNLMYFHGLAIRLRVMSPKRKKEKREGERDSSRKETQRSPLAQRSVS